MIKKEREQTILKHLSEKSVIDVQSVAKTCDVSEITIRRDFEVLEKEGKLIRTHGGATSVPNTLNDFGFNEKANSNRDGKKSICQKAAEFIKDDDIIYVDCGSTVYHLTSFIGNKKNIKVITNSIPVVSNLINHPNIKIYLIGGELDTKRQATYGPLSEMAISNYRATKAFIGAAGFSFDEGLCANDEKEAKTTTLMAHNAQEVFLLVGSRKLDKIAFVNYAKLNIADYIVSDNGLPEEFINKCIENDIKIITA
jgi:DeoR family fructose operon transcriptional repressor